MNNLEENGSFSERLLKRINIKDALLMEAETKLAKLERGGLRSMKGQVEQIQQLECTENNMNKLKAFVVRVFERIEDAGIEL